MNASQVKEGTNALVVLENENDGDFQQTDNQTVSTHGKVQVQKRAKKGDGDKTTQISATSEEEVDRMQ